MARVVLVAAALVLYAAIAMAHAGRVLGPYQQAAAEAGFDEAASAPAANQPAAVSGGGGGGGRGREGGGAIADILWFVIRWANEAPAGARHKDY